MIRIESVSKQNGHQILFVEASAALNRGEKVGLVGPNGSGKSTLSYVLSGRDGYEVTEGSAMFKGENLLDELRPNDPAVPHSKLITFVFPLPVAIFKQ